MCSSGSSRSARRTASVRFLVVDCMSTFPLVFPVHNGRICLVPLCDVDAVMVRAELSVDCGDNHGVTPLYTTMMQRKRLPPCSLGHGSELGKESRMAGSSVGSW